MSFESGQITAKVPYNLIYINPEQLISSLTPFLLVRVTFLVDRGTSKVITSPIEERFH